MPKIDERDKTLEKDYTHLQNQSTLVCLTIVEHGLSKKATNQSLNSQFYSVRKHDRYYATSSTITTGETKFAKRLLTIHLVLVKPVRWNYHT